MRYGRLSFSITHVMRVHTFTAIARKQSGKLLLIRIHLHIFPLHSPLCVCVHSCECTHKYRTVVAPYHVLNCKGILRPATDSLHALTGCLFLYLCCRPNRFEIESSPPPHFCPGNAAAHITKPTWERHRWPTTRCVWTLTRWVCGRTGCVSSIYRPSMSRGYFANAAH